MEKFLEKYLYSSAGRAKVIRWLGTFAVTGGIIVSVILFAAIIVRAQR